MSRYECSDCGSRNLYRAAKPISAGGGYAPNYLPGLGAFLSVAKFEVVVCRDCGLTRWYASDEARQQLSESPKWSSV
jgi:predicted nucleic-acid-binding Zn-ribbon protein